MTNKKREKYTLEEKAAFHKKRVESGVGSSNQQIYSANWLYGYMDQYADNNLTSTKKELAERKKYIAENSKKLQSEVEALRKMKAQNKVVFNAYINGAKARLNNKH